MPVLERFGIDEGRKGHIKGLFDAKIGERGGFRKKFSELFRKVFRNPQAGKVPPVRVELTTFRT